MKRAFRPNHARQRRLRTAIANEKSKKCDLASAHDEHTGAETMTEHPRLQRILREHPGWTIDDVLAWQREELKKHNLI